LPYANGNVNMPDHYNSNAFDEQNTEDAAGKKKKPTLWDTMKGDIMKSKTQKKKNKTIQDILNDI